ncbi:unnamed protein product, partial [Brenthis ino]
MKLLTILQICPIALLFVIHQERVLGQTLYPYGGTPIAYDNYGDDDLGLLLTVLLLATRNTNGNCNCCNCNYSRGTKTIPVPFPIPIPTNNPIITNRSSGFEYSEEDDTDEIQEEYKRNESSSYEVSSRNVTLSYVPVPIIHGQMDTLINNPIGGQNLNQALTSKAGIKSANENLIQNDNLSKGFNFNNIGQYNSQQSQLSPTLQQSFPLQQMPNVQQNPPLSLSQNLTPLVNQQQNQLSELQLPITYQPLNVPQSSYFQQPQLKDTSGSVFPAIQQASVQSVNPQPLIRNNYQQIPIGSMMQQIPVQVSQAIPTPNSYISTYSSILPVSNYGSQCVGFIPNSESNYARTFAAGPISETQIVKSYPVQYQAGLPTSNLSVLGRNIIPYQNQVFGIANSPLDIQNPIAANNDIFESDNLTSLLLSLLQTPKSTSYPQYYGRNSYVPYGTYNTNTGSKSTSLKSLLPLIFDLIKERRQNCGCNDCCRYNRNNNLKQQVEPEINGNYSRKRDYSLRDEMFHDNDSNEDIPRIAREHKKCKSKSPIPIESMESNENDEKDSDEFSEEQDN